jgi:hypothetical protein
VRLGQGNGTGAANDVAKTPHTLARVLARPVRPLAAANATAQRLVLDSRLSSLGWHLHLYNPGILLWRNRAAIGVPQHDVFGGAPTSSTLPALIHRERRRLRPPCGIA